MTAHRIGQDGFKALVDDYLTQESITDAETIRVTQSPAVVAIVTAGAETRTIGDPSTRGQTMMLYMKTDGGDATLTFSSAYDNNGTTAMTLDDVYDWAYFVSVEDAAGTFAWRLIASEGIVASSPVINIGDNTTYTLLAVNSGKTHYIPNLTADITISTPTAAAGLTYKLVYAGVAADAQDWIIDTGSDTNFFLGGLVHLDHDAGSAGDELVPIAGDGDSNSKCTVLTPHVGTEVNLYCDGTSWILSGFVVSATVPSFADQ